MDSRPTEKNISKHPELRAWMLISRDRLRSGGSVALIWFTFLSIALTWRLWLGSGQAFLLDMPWPGHFQLRDYTKQILADGSLVAGSSPGMPLVVVIAALGAVFGMAFVQKVLLASILLLAGWAMYVLAREVYLLFGLGYSDKIRNDSNMPAWLLAVVAGTIYVLNPYAIDRLWAGQWRVLAGYALAPLFVWLLFAFGVHRKGLLGRLAVVLYAVYPIISLHWWAIVSLFVLPWVSFWVLDSIRNGSKRIISWRFWGGFVLAGGLWLAFNLWWLWPEDTGVRVLGAVRPGDEQYYPVAVTLPGGIWGSVIGLGGFWRQPFSFWGAMDWAWVLFCLVMFMLSLYGVWLLLRPSRPGRNNRLLFWLGGGLASALIAVLLIVCLGTSTVYGLRLQQAFFTLPGFIGFREISKLVGLLAFVYALAVPIGLVALLRHTTFSVSRQIGAILGFMIAIISLMLPAFHATYLRPYKYPAAWQSTNQMLVERGAKRVLVLPYVNYTKLAFAGDYQVASPEQYYFDPLMLTGKTTGNPLYDKLHERDTGAVAVVADGLLSGTTRAQDLDMLSIDHVIIALSSGRDIPPDTQKQARLHEVGVNQSWKVYSRELK